MTAFLDITAALDGRLSTLASSPPVAWPNRSYTPITGTLWLRPTHLPADTVGATLSDTGTDQHQGVYQIDVFSPAGDGKGPAYVWADSIAAHFKPVTELTYNGRLVRCVAVSVGAAAQDNGWYQLPVSVNYISFTEKR